MHKGHENYKELVLRLAKTDFKLRYHGNVLGYLWAIIKPLSMFTILNFVFSSIFNFKNSGVPFYSLELLTALLLFQFFSEGTMNGMQALVAKSQLVTKIYVPKWTIVLASTLNSFFIFGTNLVVLTLFFSVNHKTPTLMGILSFLFYAVLLYILVIAFAFLSAAFYVRFRDLGTIWEVLLSVLMYAAPIVYPLSVIPDNLQRLLLINPLAFIINFAKQGLIYGIYAKPEQIFILVLGVLLFLVVAILVFNKFQKKVAEYI
ncbi:MAG: ABC transporter permease [Candidatus Doudnabacteria bacterium]|nr:ABC transporter permease [Candidatus Doudnabacteria bacterium]